MSDTPLCTSSLPILSDFEMGFLSGVKAYDDFLMKIEWLEKDGELGIYDPRHKLISYFGSSQELQDNLQQWTQKRAELTLKVIQERADWADDVAQQKVEEAEEAEEAKEAEEAEEKKVDDESTTKKRRLQE